MCKTKTYVLFEDTLTYVIVLMVMRYYLVA